MSGLSLVTHGWICQGGRTVIVRCTLPLNLALNDTEALRLRLKAVEALSLNLLDTEKIHLAVKQQSLNLKIRDIGKLNLNIQKCED